MKKIIDTNVLLDYPQIVEKEDDNLMRVLSKDIAQELMEISFQKEEGDCVINEGI